MLNRYSFNTELIPDEYFINDIQFPMLPSIREKDQCTSQFEYRLSASGSHFVNIIYKEIWMF